MIPEPPKPRLQYAWRVTPPGLCEPPASTKMGPTLFYTGVANQMGQRDSPLPAPSTPSTRGRPTSGCPRHLGGKPTAAKLTSSKALRLHRLRGSRGLARLHGLHRLRHCKCSERTGKEREQTLDERGQASSLSRGASEEEPWCRHMPPSCCEG